MTERLKDKVAIVVGAGCTPGETIGNGRAAAILFARAGASIILADRDADSVAETKHAIDAEGGESSVVEADVTRADACAHITEECLRRYGRIDVLHNNVGIGVLGGAVELAEADWDRVLNTNLKAMFLTCKHVLPHMERRGCGAIVNVSSVAAERAAAAYPLLAYSASKGGVNALTRSMAMQYAAKGIRVNAIMPGLIKTPMAVDEPARRYGLDREGVHPDARRSGADGAHGRGMGRGLGGGVSRLGRGAVHHRRRAPRGRRAFLQGVGASRTGDGHRWSTRTRRKGIADLRLGKYTVRRWLTASARPWTTSSRGDE